MKDIDVTGIDEILAAANVNQVDLRFRWTWTSFSFF